MVVDILLSFPSYYGTWGRTCLHFTWLTILVMIHSIAYCITCNVTYTKDNETPVNNNPSPWVTICGRSPPLIAFDYTNSNVMSKLSITNHSTVDSNHNVVDSNYYQSDDAVLLIYIGTALWYMCDIWSWHLLNRHGGFGHVSRSCWLTVIFLTMGTL